MELLKSGTLEVPETQDSAIEAENVDDSPGSQATNEVNSELVLLSGTVFSLDDFDICLNHNIQVRNNELLEIEKREVIGMLS